MPFRKKDGWGRQKPPFGSQIDWGHPLAKDLAACWLMNEAGGGIIHDLVNQNNCSLTGTTGKPTFVRGGFGGSALNFVAANSQYATGVNTKQIHPGLDNNAETIVAWCRWDAYPGSDTAIYGKSDGDSSHGAYFVADLTNFPQVALGATWPCSNTDAGIFASLVNGITSRFTTGFHQVAMKAKQSNTTAGMNCYLDGLPMSQLGSTPSFTAGSGNNLTDITDTLYIGRRWDGHYFNGDIDHILIYKRLLSDKEIQELFAHPFAFIQSPKRRIISQPLFTQGTANITSPSLVSATGKAIRRQSAAITSPSNVSGRGTGIHPLISNILSPSVVSGHVTNLQRQHASILSPSTVRGKRSPGVPLETTSVANLSADFTTITQMGAST